RRLCPPSRPPPPGTRAPTPLPRLPRHTEKLALVRSMPHRSTPHGRGMYWTLTGHPPQAPEVAINQPPSRQDWPNLGAIVARLRRAPPGFPAAVQLPYPMVDNNTLQAGENAGSPGGGLPPPILPAAPRRPPPRGA